MLSLKQLLAPPTEAEALATIISVLQQAGFQATSWDSGSIQLTTLSLFSRAWSLIANTIADIAAGGFTTLATGDFLTLLARYIYNIERNAAQATLGKILLSSTAGGTTTFSAGDITVSTSPSGTPGAVTFTCTAGGSILSGGSLSVAFAANVAGAAANIAPNSTLYLWTPIPGITATNPPIAGSSTWITTPGADQENDTRLTLRCQGRWERLTYGNTEGAYKGWALEALPELQRVDVISSVGNGTVILACATSLGGITAAQATTIADYINGVSDGKGRRPINDIVSAQAPSVLTTPAINYTAYVTPDALGTAAAQITAALINYIGTVPIGGTQLVGGGSGVVLLYGLVKATTGITGVVSVDLGITTDIPVSPGQIYTPTITATIVQVAPVD